MKVDVVIVSGFGRGLWLSALLAQEGLSTVYLDCSEQLGAWAPEDWEGPFGYFMGSGSQERRQLVIKEFQKEISLEKQMERLHCDEALIANENGFVLWGSQGPIELKGPLTKQMLKKDSTIKTVDLASRLIANTAVNLSWNEEVKTVMKNDAIPLQSEYFIKHTSRKSFQKSLEWARSKGVFVPENAKLVDILIENKNLMTGIEVKADRSFVIQPDEVVWGLSSEETRSLSSKVQKQIYPEGVLEPLWSWVRYRLKIKDSPEQRQFPWHMCLLQDELLPWTHENFLVMQRTSSPELFDVWMRIPNIQRFNKIYLQDKATAAMEVLKQRLPQVEILLQDEPQEYRYNYNELGGSRFPVYDKKSLQKHRPIKMKNTYFDGPEQWKVYTYSSMAQTQEGILIEILKKHWKKQEKLKRMEKSKKKDADKDNQKEDVEL